MNVTRGILLLEPGAPRPAGLDDDALTTCDDPYRALADLVILAQAERRRAAWGLDGAHRLRLVVAPPRTETFDRLATRLVESVCRAAPSIAVVDLRMGTDDAAPARPRAATTAPAPVGDAPRVAPPPLPTAPPAAPAPRAAPADHPPDLDDPERLSADEIAMLLDDEESPR